MLENGAQVDKVDVKAQTPLFVAMVNQHWECAEALLEAGADPNGNEKNLCTPLAVMAQRGYYEGMCRVENIFKGSLDLIPSPSPSEKIQIMGGKVCLRCNGKTLLGVFNKL